MKAIGAIPVDRGVKVLLAGGIGLVGGAICRGLEAAGYSRDVAPTHAQVDLTDQAQVRELFAREVPDVVIVAAARVGGIMASQTHSYEFVRDNFDLETSHLVPALLRKSHEAKVAAGEGGALEVGACLGSTQPASVVLWGTGTPRRELLHMDDLAEAVCLPLGLKERSKVQDDLLNVGTGVDCGIRALADTVQKVVGQEAPVEWDGSKPDGTPQKLLDVSRMCSLGWEPKLSLGEGLGLTYEWYLSTT